MTQYRIEWRLLKYSRISSNGDWHDSKEFLEQNTKEEPVEAPEEQEEEATVEEKPVGLMARRGE